MAAVPSSAQSGGRRAPSKAAVIAVTGAVGLTVLGGLTLWRLLRRRSTAVANTVASVADGSSDAPARLGLYSAEQRILVVGDGNFSFSESLARHLGLGSRLVATSFDSPQYLAQRHPDALATVGELRRLGVTVLHSVDATDLAACIPADIAAAGFDVIVFNFPHHPGKGRIDLNRQLVLKFLTSAAGLLAPGKGQIHVALLAGQGGTAVDLPREECNHWHLTDAGAAAGCRLLNVLPFVPADYPGYRASGRRGGAASFYAQSGFVHILTPDPTGAQQEGLNAERARKLHLLSWDSVRCQPHPLHLANVDAPSNPVSLLLREGHPVAEAAAAAQRAIMARMPNVVISCDATTSMPRTQLADPAVCPADDRTNGIVFPSPDDLEGSVWRPHLSYTLAASLLTSAQGAAVVGQVFRRLPMNTWQYPVQHHIDVAVRCPGLGYESVVDQMSVGSQAVVNSMFEGTKQLALVWIDLAALKNEPAEGVENPTDEILPAFITATHRRVLMGKLPRNYDRDLADLELPLVWAAPLSAEYAASLGWGSDTGYWMRVHLDAVAMVRRQVQDARLLWSEHPATDVHTCAAPNKFPSQHRLDVSFWIEGSMDPRDIAHISRIATADGVENVQLINDWIQEPAMRHSQCFRIWFRRHDYPLSWEGAKDLHESVLVGLQAWQRQLELRKPRFRLTQDAPAGAALPN